MTVSSQGRASLSYAAGALTPSIVLSVAFYALVVPQAPNGASMPFVLASAVSVLLFSLIAFAGCAQLFYVSTAHFKRKMWSLAAYFLGLFFGLLGVGLGWFVHSLSDPIIGIVVVMLAVPILAGFLAPLLGHPH